MLPKYILSMLYFNSENQGLSNTSLDKPVLAGLLMARSLMNSNIQDGERGRLKIAKLIRR